MQRRTRQRSTSKNNRDGFQSALKRLLSPGSKYREAKHGAFIKARPILASLTNEFPAIDTYYCLWLLGALIKRMAPLNDPKLVASWRALIKAYKSLKEKAEAFHLATGGLEEIQASFVAAESEARTEGKQIKWELTPAHLAAHLADPLNATFDPAFQVLDERFDRLSRYYELSLEPPERGRPSYFWIDTIASLLDEHFEQKIPMSKWRRIGQLIECVPLPDNLPIGYLEPRQIRQRLVRWKRLETRGGTDPGLEPLRGELRRAYDEHCGRTTKRKRSKQLEAHIRQRWAEVEKRMK